MIQQLLKCSSKMSRDSPPVLHQHCQRMCSCPKPISISRTFPLPTLHPELLPPLPFNPSQKSIPLSFSSPPPHLPPPPTKNLQNLTQPPPLHPPLPLHHLLNITTTVHGLYPLTDRETKPAVLIDIWILIFSHRPFEMSSIIHQLPTKTPPPPPLLLITTLSASPPSPKRPSHIPSTTPLSPPSSFHQHSTHPTSNLSNLLQTPSYPTSHSPQPPSISSILSRTQPSLQIPTLRKPSLLKSQYLGPKTEPTMSSFISICCFTPPQSLNIQGVSQIKTAGMLNLILPL